MGRRLRSAPFFIRASGSHATSKSRTFGIELGPAQRALGLLFMCLRTQKRVDSEIAPRNHSGVVLRPSASKAKEMPGDPNRCREHARRCAEIARHTPSPEVRDHFTSLEQSWLRLAAEIESGQRLLDLIGKISRDLVPSAEAAG